MPSLTTVIDDKSPLISYDSTWTSGTSLDDPLATSYFLGTFTRNNVTDGSAHLSFNGTAIWIYGAKRTNHGTYSIQVDDATYSGFNGEANNLFQQILFNMSLNQAMHTVTLTNTGTGVDYPYVDIDMIVWQSEVGGSDDLVSEAVQDTDPRFQYQEPAWDTTSNILDLHLFANGTGHVTETYDANVTFTFTVGTYPFKSIISGLSLTGLLGEAVTIYGTSGSSNGPYSVQLDGGNVSRYNASFTSSTGYGVVIYHADNLGSGSHQLVFTNLPDQSGELLSIDYAQLWTIANGTTSTVSIPSSQVTSQNNLSTGALVGIIVAAVAAILGAGAAVLFYRRWKAALASQQDLYRVYALQRRVPEVATVAPTGFSSSLPTRSNTSLLRHDTSAPVLTGRAQQAANNHATRDEVPLRPLDSRNSGSIIDAMISPSDSLVEEDLGQRRLPEPPGGGLSLSAEFPKLAEPQRRQSVVVADNHSSMAISEVPPPNYIQATGNGATMHE